MSAPRQQADFDSAPGTRERILGTAASRFAEYGYDNTSLSEVARAAGVSKALILWHFESKETLYRAAVRRTLEPYFIDVDDLEGLDERTQIERLIEQFYEFVRENVYSVRFLLCLVVGGEKQPNEVAERAADLYRVFRGLFADVIDRGRRKGSFRADAEPELDASLILAMLAGILIEHFMGGHGADRPERLLSHLKASVIRRLLG